MRLDRGHVLARREARHRRNPHTTGLDRNWHHRRRHADRVDAEFGGFGDQRGHIGTGGLRLEQGVVYQRGQLRPSRLAEH